MHEDSLTNEAQENTVGEEDEQKNERSCQAEHDTRRRKLEMKSFQLQHHIRPRSPSDVMVTSVNLHVNTFDEF